MYASGGPLRNTRLAREGGVVSNKVFFATSTNISSISPPQNIRYRRQRRIFLAVKCQVKQLGNEVHNTPPMGQGTVKVKNVLRFRGPFFWPCNYKKIGLTR